MNWLSNGSSIGVVTFSGSARVVAPLTSVTSEQVRRSLTTLIDGIEATGSTSIGQGLRKGVEVSNGSYQNVLFG
jgi:uncharacterized protein YegL